MALPALLLIAVSLQAAEYLTYDAAAPALRACRLPVPAGRDRWPAWIENRDREIRSRLVRGQEDSLVNFVLFGVSFTRQPRIESDHPDPSLVQARVRDFVHAMASPEKNERLASLRELVATRQDPERYVFETIARYRAEQQQYQRILDTAPENDPVVSQLYRNRGLSLDTNFRPNYAIEKTLAELKRRGALTGVRRAAIIGPGLDFTDKAGGFDYYPLQTLQPFALIDSLVRLGFSKLPELHVTVFDISPEVLRHLSHPRQPYTMQLVLDRARPWNPDTLAYWRRFGDRVGTPAQPWPLPPQIRNVARRAVTVRPQVLAALDSQPLDIVLQHAPERYDLIIATNVFVYYDELSQALSLLNIESMLAPGGILLSNSPLRECSMIHKISSVNVTYSRTPGDDDQVISYSNTSLRRSSAPE